MKPKDYVGKLVKRINSRDFLRNIPEGKIILKSNEIENRNFLILDYADGQGNFEGGFWFKILLSEQIGWIYFIDYQRDLVLI